MEIYLVPEEKDGSHRTDGIFKPDTGSWQKDRNLTG